MSDDAGDWWNVNQVKNVSKAKTGHPCQMPVEVMKNIIGILPDGIGIIDPFLCGGTDGVSSAYDVEKLADLIDCPTCRIIKSAKIYTAFGELIDTMNVYVLSCGHQAVGFEKPDYCPKCGTRVGR